jgi:hypothetical protein
MKTNRLKLVPVLLGLVASVAHCSSDNATQGNPDASSGEDASTPTGNDASTPTGDDASVPTGSDATTPTGNDASAPTGNDGAVVPEAGSEPVTVAGTVASVAFLPGSTTEPTIVGGHYLGATVCVDANNNGKCDTGETQTTTDSGGNFRLTLPALAPLIADIGTTAENTASNAKVSTRTVFRASVDQVAEAPGRVALSALSTEVVRLTEANATDYVTEKQSLAARLTTGAVQVTPDLVLTDVNSLAGSTKVAMLGEANILTGRFAYAITKLDRGDLYPDALAVPGGDPELTAIAAADGGVTAATATTAETRHAITFAQAEQAAFNVEAIPRYDHIFIVMLENKATEAILGSTFAPRINAYLAAGNQAISYYATGNPSEPNYTALGGGDDFGLTDDSQWNCDATGANAVTDLPVPDNTAPGLASSPFATTCTQTVGTNHNITGKANLFNSINAAGMTWRTYSESMNPGQDFRTDSVADPGVIAQDHVYPPGTVGGNLATIGNPGLVLPLPASLYKTKHHPGMAYQNVRSEPDFKFSNRTLGGGQWDSALKNTTKYAIPANYDYDQLGTDLVTGDVGNLNFLVPDQCDDMHGTSVTGTVLPAGEAGVATGVSASDCSGVANNVAVGTGGAIITRGDNYVDYVVKKIQRSDLWNNPQKKVAIVLMFDEGSATSGFNSCCGWKAGKTATNPLLAGAGGTWTVDSSNAQYSNGNQGHGMSVFGVLTNQASAPKHVLDSDSYSHFSFVRTLQDMFLLSDPKNDASYANRSKYTEKFIAQNILNLPEFTASADTHYDSVRPMNHAFVIPASYVAKQSTDDSRTALTGPDPNQTNIWATK